MRCPSCRSANDDARRFCGACGAALPLPCGRCGFANAPGDRFCGGCGAALVADAPPAEPAGERRQVAILFADLCGSTDLATRLDAEDMRDLLGKVLDAIDAEVASHGGAIDKHMGDGAMALFGAPVAHGDDALRAVHAAAAIHGRVGALAMATGRPLAVHVGIAAGEVVAGGVGRAGGDSYTVIGESVHVAARLLERAGPGETLVSDDVAERVAGRVALSSAGETVPRGLGRAIRVWRLADGAAAPARSAAPFVGRAAELARVDAVLDASRAGRGQVVVVRGEAGIGKSHLAEHVIERAERAGFRAHRAHVVDFGAGKGQDAIRALVRDLLGLRPGVDKAARAAAGADALAKGWLAPADQPHLDALLDLPGDATGRAVIEAMDPAARDAARRGALVALLRGATAEAPRLVVVEDIHWSDPATLADLAALARALPDQPATFVVTTRRDGDPLDAAWVAGAGDVQLTTIDLGPLGPQESAALARALAADASREVARCIERAEGNPLFLVQLLHHARERAGDQVPGTIQSLVHARVDRLAPSDRAAIQAASVLGQRFDPAALRHVLRDGAYTPDALVAAGLMRRDGPALAFAHALIRDGVRASLVKGRLRDLHGRAADWFTGRDLVLRAEHLARAESPEAAGAYLAAAEDETRRSRPERTLELATAGAAHARDDDTARALALTRGDALLDLGRAREAIEAYGAAPGGGDGRARARRLLGMAEAKRLSDDLDGAFAMLAEAEPIARGDGLMSIVARIETLRGNLHFPRGEIAACQAAHGRAITAARASGSVEDEARALGGLADAAYAAGHLSTARRHLEACLDLCERHGLVRIDAANRPMYALALFNALDMEASRAQAERAIALARRVGHRRAETIGVHSRQMVDFVTGDYEAAERGATDAIRLARSLGSGRFEAEGLAMRAAALMEMGRRAEAKTEIDAALRVARASGLSYWGPIILAWSAQHTDGPEARTLLDEAEGLLDTGSLCHNHIFYAAAAIDRAVTIGDWDEACRQADRLDRYMAREPLPLTDFMAARARALARWGRGDRSDAARAEITRLRAFARDKGVRQGTAAFDDALAAWPSDRANT